MPSQYVIGIDLGTTNSVVAYTQTDVESNSPSIELLQLPQLVAAGTVESRESLPSFAYLATEAESNRSICLGLRKRKRPSANLHGLDPLTPPTDRWCRPRAGYATTKLIAAHQFCLSKPLTTSPKSRPWRPLGSTWLTWPPPGLSLIHI